MLAARLSIQSWREDVKAVIDQARSNDLDPQVFPEFADASCRELDDLLPGPVVTGTLDRLQKSLNKIMADADFRDSGVNKTRSYLDVVQQVQRSIHSGQPVWSLLAKLIGARPQAALTESAEKLADLAARHDRDQAFRDDVFAYSRAVFELAALAIQAFAREKDERGLIDFIDQEHRLLKLLDLPEVVEQLRESVDLLVVDEFQDTSPIQLALFVKLSRIARETYWVGDIKQAIYGFRGADPAFMESILEARNELGMGDETLDTSYRSRPQLVSLTNALFVPAFAPRLAADRVELQPAREGTLKDPALGLWMIEGRNVQKRAAAIANGVRALIQSGYQVPDRETEQPRRVRYADIAILARLNDNADRLADALAAVGIPVSRRRQGLLAQPECVLLAACLRRLADPADTVATAEIVSLSRCLEPEQWLSDRMAHLDSGGKRSDWLEQGDGADPIIARLAMLRTTVRFSAPAQALEQVIAECDLVSRVLQWQDDADTARRRLASIDAFKELITAFEEERRRLDAPCSIATLIAWLDGVKGTDDDRLPVAEVDAVTVDTYHGSKGLEWPVVVMTELETGAKSRVWGASVVAGEFLATAPLQGRRIRFWPWPYGKMSKLALTDLVEASTIGQEALGKATEEAKRLLYVGLTRARDQLVLAFQSGARQRGALEVLGCDWLPGNEAEASALKLPNGTSVAISRMSLEGEAGADMPSLPAARSGLGWYSERLPSADPPRPMFVTPSTAEPVECQLVETVQVHDPVPVSGSPDPVALGTAVHGVMAALLARPGDPQAEFTVGRILHAFGVNAALDCQQLIATANALESWLDCRWSGYKKLCEQPFEVRKDDTRVYRGQLDLVLISLNRVVVIDFKAILSSERSHAELANRYAGQLKAYRTAIASTELRAQPEAWLLLPLQGVALQVKP